MSVKIFAAIDVGSFEVSMKIVEFSGKNKSRVLEHVCRRISLGNDTYGTKKISNEKMDELCRTLKEFSMIMKMYRVDSYKAYGTSAIRETENTSIVLDQIMLRTGINIECISNSEQRFLDYKSIAFSGETFNNIIKEGTAIVDIGGGSIQISLFDKDMLIATQNIKLGVLRMQSWLNRINVTGSQYEELIDEMAMAQLGTFKKMYLKDYVIKNLIVVDDYLSVYLSRKIRESARPAIVSLEEYEKFLKMVKANSVAEIARKINVSEEYAALTFISSLLVKNVMNLMNAQFIWAPGVSLCDGIAYEYAEEHKLLSCDHDFEKDIIACARNISKRYMGSKKRGETLEYIALTIFDSIKKLHGLGSREKLYLRIAALLHDCGKYISMMDIGETSYHIIMATEIIGLSHAEREIVANIVRFNHTPFIYYKDVKAGNTKLSKDAYLIVAKLTAILRVANGLDRSHKEKLKEIRARLKEDELILTVDSQTDISLEKGLFENRALFFQEVFSVKPIIKQRKNI